MGTAAPGRWLPTLCAILALVSAGCGGIIGGTSGDGRDAAVAFLDDLKAGRIEGAWQGTSPEFKSLMGLDSLRDYVKTHPALKGQAEYAESRDATREGHTLIEHVFRAKALVRKKAVPATVKVLVAPGAKGWAVEKLSVE